MDSKELIIQEYNNLWNEKLIHKQGIRKFHNYLTYLMAIGTLALAFHGLSTNDILAAVNNTDKAKEFTDNASSIMHLFFIPFTPVLLITLTFPLNDMFHIYAIGNHIGQIEKKINKLENPNLLVWEHSICPKVYGGSEDHEGNKILNIITLGDSFLLIPALLVIGAITSYISANFICENLSSFWAWAYIVLILYMFITIAFLGRKLLKYTSPEGKLTKILANANNPPEEDKKEIVHEEIEDKKGLVD